MCTAQELFARGDERWLASVREVRVHFHAREGLSLSLSFDGRLPVPPPLWLNELTVTLVHDDCLRELVCSPTWSEVDGMRVDALLSILRPPSDWQAIFVRLDAPPFTNVGVVRLGRGSSSREYDNLTSAAAFAARCVT